MRRYPIVRRHPFDRRDLDQAVEVVVAEADQAMADDAPADEGFRALTALVSLTAEPGARRGLAALAGSLEFAQVTRHRVPFDGCGEFLAARAATLDADWVDVVLLPGADGRFARDHVQRLVDTLHRYLGHRLALLFVVGERADDLTGWRQVSGCVGGAGDPAAMQAARLFLMAAALAAPVTYACVDHADVRCLLDAAPRGLVVVEAVWLREPGRLLFASADDARRVARADGLWSLLPAGTAGVFDDHRRFVDAIGGGGGSERGDGGSERLELHHLAPDLMGALRRQPGIAPVLLLCADGPA